MSKVEDKLNSTSVSYMYFVMKSVRRCRIWCNC